MQTTEAQIFGLEGQSMDFSKKIGFDPSPAVIARGEELRKEALRLKKEKETKRISFKIFDWLKKTPINQIGIITDWADHNLPSGAIRCSIVRTKKSQNFIIKVSGIIGDSSYKLGQTWYIRNVPYKVKTQLKQALKEKLEHNNKDQNISSILTEIRFAQ